MLRLTATEVGKLDPVFIISIESFQLPL